MLYLRSTIALSSRTNLTLPVSVLPSGRYPLHFHIHNKIKEREKPPYLCYPRILRLLCELRWHREDNGKKLLNNIPNLLWILTDFLEYLVGVLSSEKKRKNLGDGFWKLTHRPWQKTSFDVCLFSMKDWMGTLYLRLLQEMILMDFVIFSNGRNAGWLIFQNPFTFLFSDSMSTVFKLSTRLFF